MTQEQHRTTPIRRLLVANRGEIACRVMRTARAMGIDTVAVYSDGDTHARHVREADEAIRIGPVSAADSYLNIDAVIDAARRTGSDAIHPGYGFLSENAGFVEALEQADILFVGPPGAAITAMGDKAAAKLCMERAEVPLVPGYHGYNQDAEQLQAEAERIGYPVLLKASAGGGGKGMRVVQASTVFQAALDGCRRESQAAFGDQRMLIEKYLTQPRHVEVQVFCDRHGNGVFLFERDCSVQRRHQKVLEEAPAPGLSDTLRRQMGEAAVRAAREIGYVGAGTVEFLLDADGAFYFMEMNTRLQVEHPVTEMITGEDLVEWQLRVAMGEPLPRSQGELGIHGHSFEARLYAEDPEQDFLPAVGVLERFEIDPAGVELHPARVRLDSGVESGDTVSMHYDPLLAKLIVHARDRDEALDTLGRALAAMDIQGVTTNQAFLLRLASHPAFRAVDLDTRFIERHEDTLLPPRIYAPEDYAGAALIGLDALAREGESDSPWARRDGFRLNAPHQIRIALCDPGFARADDAAAEVVVVDGRRETATDDWLLRIGEHEMQATLQHLSGNAVAITLDGHRRRLQARLEGGPEGSILVMVDRQAEKRLFWRRIDAIDHGHHESESTLTAPMFGVIVAAHVAAGERVEKGTALMVLEAMKMEHAILAPAAGTVEAVHFEVGDSVGQGEVLIDFAAEEE